MRNFVKSIGVFVPICILVYIVMVCMVEMVLPRFLKPNINFQIGGLGQMNARISEINQFEDIDILFLGSSHAYRGFDTRVYKNNGFNVFNLGSSNQTPMQTSILLDRYLDKLNPKVVIMEVNPMSFESDGIESALDIIANDKNDLETIKMVWDLGHIKVFNAAIIGFLRDWTNWDIGNVAHDHNVDDHYISGGFVEKNLLFYNSKPIQEQKIIFLNNQLLAFSKVIKLFRDEEIKLFLVRAPVSSSLYHSYLNNADFDRKMSGYGPYLNFNKLMTLMDTLDFYDQHHLNKNGVQLFNNLLMEQLNLEEIINRPTEH